MRTLLSSRAIRFLVACVAYAGLSGVAVAGGSLPIPQDPAIDYFMRVALGQVPGHTAVIVYGENHHIPSGGAFETIWDGSNIYVPPADGIAVLHDVVSDSVDDVGTERAGGTATGGSLTTLIDTSKDFVALGVAAGDSLLNDANTEFAVITGVAETTLTAFIGMQHPNSGLRGPPAGIANPQLYGHANEAGDAYRVVANDDAGASYLYLLGQNAIRIEVSEFIVLNGQTDVTTANEYVRIRRMRVFGSNESLGVITAETDDVASTVTAQINAENNQTLMAIYTCPLTHTCTIVYWWGSLSKGVGATTASIMELMGGTLDGVPYKLQPRAYTSTASSSHEHPYMLPVPFAGGADVWLKANSTTNDTGVSGGFYLVNVEN